MKKCDREIMEILEAYDATGSAHSAAQLAGVDPKTVRRYVAARDAGRRVVGPARRPRIIDQHVAKIEEWVERSQGKVRADVIHERLVAMGFTGTERTTGEPSPRRRRRGRPDTGAPIGRGSRSRACGCSSTGARDRGCRVRTG